MPKSVSDAAGSGRGAMTPLSPVTDKLAPRYDRIFLEPECATDERCWCQHDQGPCDDCGLPWIEYIRADLVPNTPNLSGGEVERIIRELAGKLYAHSVIKYDPKAAERCIVATVAALSAMSRDDAGVVTEEMAAHRILIILGACRDDMSSEAVKAFQALADELRRTPVREDVAPSVGGEG